MIEKMNQDESILHSLVLRPIQLSDLDAFEALAFSAQSGLTSLPKDRSLLKLKIEHSLASFKNKVKKPGGEIYIFVLENTKNNDIVGTCAIFSLIGFPDPFYTFDIKKITKVSELVNQKKDLRLLTLKTLKNGPTEVGGLYLKPEYRKKGVGRFLSLSRFLFIALNRERFNSKVIAEMRGVIDDSGKSPFWTHVGKTFFDMSFLDADLLSVKNKSFIADLIPRYPIYINLLPKTVQDIIGKPHQNTIPALKLLESEGFSFSNSIDIFDGGPKIECEMDRIRTVSGAFKAKIKDMFTVSDQDDLFMCSNKEAEKFRACCGHLQLGEDQDVKIQTHIASQLDVSSGDLIYGASLYRQPFLGRFASWYKKAMTISKITT